MVARKLVEKDSGNNPETVGRIEARARYCQILAHRLKLGALQSHRVALAAWLSALGNKLEAVRQLADGHNLNEILFPSGSTADGFNAEARILAVVKAYESLRDQCPEAVATPGKAVQSMTRVLPEDKEQKHILKLFGKVLEDEMFLSGGHSGIGRILVVDPEEAISPVLSPPLTSDGYEVKVAPTVEAARNVLENFHPNLVIAELDMPVVDGIAFCSEIKRNANTADIPFLMLTSSKGSKTHSKCLKSGADDVLVRPVDLEMLFLRLSRLIKAPDKEKPAEGGVTGSLSEMGFADIVQIITAGGRSMEIVLTRNGEQAIVCIEKGEIIHAAVGPTEGEAAFFQLMRWAEGSFTTHHRETFDKHTIHGTVMGLLMEGARLVDEQK